ncbi:MAG: YihY family inner membrane protein [Deltaproteobacteria bacterium]|nr:YihY family inner membrane protein [Deltaproteobacteria bacterium]
MKSFLSQIADFVRGALKKDLTQLTGLDQVVVYPVRFFLYVGRELHRDNCFQQASGLAFKTVISLVPLLAVAFSLLKVFGAFKDAGSKIISLMLALDVFPVTAEKVAEYLTGLTSQVSAGALGVVGMSTLIIVGILLFDNIERIFNDIFKVERRRSPVSRFLTFYAIITLGPLALAGSLYFTAGVGRQLGGGTFVHFFHKVFMPYLLPFMISWISLAFTYWFLPNTRVSAKAVAAGGAIAAFLFEIAKFLFKLYITGFAFSSWGKIYGALALFPIFLVWVYIAWIISLFGAEVAYTLQNMHVLMEADQERRKRLSERVDEIFAARLFLEIAYKFRSRGGPVLVSDLALTFRITGGLVEKVCRRFIDAGLLIRVSGDRDEPAYILSKPPDLIGLKNLFSAFRVGYLDIEAELHGNDVQSNFSKLKRRMDQALENIVYNVTVQDILDDAMNGEESHHAMENHHDGDAGEEDA